MRHRILARVSDNVLSESDWPIAALGFADGELTEIMPLQHGLYSIYGLHVPVLGTPGTTLDQLFEWQRYDGTGQHPEMYHELRDPRTGEWDSWRSRADFDSLLARTVQHD